MVMNNDQHLKSFIDTFNTETQEQCSKYPPASFVNVTYVLEALLVHTLAAREAEEDFIDPGYLLADVQRSRNVTCSIMDLFCAERWIILNSDMAKNTVH